VVFFDEGNTQDDFGYWVYLRSTDGSAPVRLGSGRSLSLSPDGRWLLTLANPFSDPHFALLPTGPGERRPLPATRANPQALAEYLPDGESFVFAGNEPGVGMRLYLRSLDGTVERPLTPAGIDFEYNGFAVSPDGTLVAAPDVDGDLMLYSTSDAEARPALGVEPGQIPIQWGSDNHTLYVFQPAELPARITSVDLRSGQQTRWLELSPTDAAGVSAIDFVWLTPDGKSYVYSFKRLLSQLYVVDGLR
jgi:hypothetical protein